MSLEHVAKKLSLNTENLLKKSLDKLLPHPLSQLNERSCGTFYTSYKLLDDQFWLSMKWIDKNTTFNLDRHFFPNIIDPRVVKMLTYCKKNEKMKKWQILLFSCYWPSVYLIHYRWSSRSYSLTDLIRLVLTVYNCMEKMSISPQTPSITWT